MNTPTILICDDDPVVHESLALYLDNDNFEHIDAYDGKESLEKVASSNIDLILLDVMMPKIVGLELGADDYIVKPFSPREVIARIKAVLRRSDDQTPAQPTTIHYEGLDINLNNYSVRINGESIPFTPKEVEILYLLASHPGQVYNREKILETIWGLEYNGDSRTVDTHIKRIRQKVTFDNAAWSIKTIYGVGYKFEVN